MAHAAHSQSPDVDKLRVVRAFEGDRRQGRGTFQGCGSSAVRRQEHQQEARANLSHAAKDVDFLGKDISVDETRAFARGLIAHMTETLHFPHQAMENGHMLEDRLRVLELRTAFQPAAFLETLDDNERAKANLHLSKRSQSENEAWEQTWYRGPLAVGPPIKDVEHARSTSIEDDAHEGILEVSSREAHLTANGKRNCPG